MTIAHRVTTAIVVACSAAFLVTGVAHADPAPDPHIPNPLVGYCPGGGAGNVFEGYCDGVKYPDGSYWHRINYGTLAFPFTMPGQTEPMQLGLSCVVDPDNGPIPQPAPPGGCGGAVQ